MSELTILHANEAGEREHSLFSLANFLGVPASHFRDSICAGKAAMGKAMSVSLPRSSTLKVLTPASVRFFSPGPSPGSAGQVT